MPDRSPSPSTEIQQTLGRQTLRTFDTGHPLHPTQGPQASASSSGLDSQPAASKSLFTLDLGPNFVPDSMLAPSDDKYADSEPESISDNGQDEDDGEEQEDQA